MGFWSSLLKTGGKAAGATGKAVGGAVLHPSQTLRGAGSALKTATVGAAAGYVGWEKLTTDKSVVRIVSDAVIGEDTTNAISGTAKAATETVNKLTGKAEQTFDSVSQASSSLSSTLDGASNFLSGVSNGECREYVRQLFQQPRAWQNIGIKHSRIDCRGIPRVRTYRLARQDSRYLLDHDDDWQQHPTPARSVRYRQPASSPSTAGTGGTDP